MGKSNIAPTCGSDKPTGSSFPDKGLRPAQAGSLDPGPVECKKAIPRGTLTCSSPDHKQGLQANWKPQQLVRTQRTLSG